MIEITAKPLGILGGGQLARMMALKAHEMGLPVAILSENADDPAAQVAPLWIKGKLDDPKTIEAFLRKCAVATFESEFLDAELLEKARKKTKTPIFPRPREMAKLQDRLTQKQLLVRSRIPTAEYYAVNTVDQALDAFTRLQCAAVFKKRRFGYDGYGTFVVRDSVALEKFLPELAKNPHGFIAEKFVPFRRELAVMIARGKNGGRTALPFVETFQENSRCLWVKGPLKTTKTLATLEKNLLRFLDDIGYVGIMGVELFETSQGLLVNELAPRVHNSAHYSLEGLSDDQFSLHIKAVLGAELSRPELVSGGFAMMNLLGSSRRVPRLRLTPHVHLHWYGKTENRPGRKMGHLNAIDSTPDKALARVKKARAGFGL
jgi:5-(carboxyamino)imidazole ribonucleotide synthase